jgi:hypothetical protein
VVDAHAFTLELMRDAPIAVARILQADLLDSADQRRIVDDNFGPMVVLIVQ